MEYGCVLLAVKDMEAAKKFYTELLDLTITLDIGSNVALGPVALQAMDWWPDFVNAKPEKIAFGNRASELVFEEADFDGFLQKMKAWGEVELVHDVRVFPWGQRVIRMFDPDRHIVEVGETMKVVIQRFLRQGKTVDEVVEITMFPKPLIEEYNAELQ